MSAFTMFRTKDVSVPLPGFSGLRHPIALNEFSRYCFSPVAGIQWVETVEYSLNRSTLLSFSPVAGIQWVETREPRYTNVSTR